MELALAPDMPLAEEGRVGLALRPQDQLLELVHDQFDRDVSAGSGGDDRDRLQPEGVGPPVGAIGDPPCLT